MKTIEISIGGRKKVLPSEVILLVADINYTKLFCENGEKIIVATTLGKLEKRFSESNFFFRPHKSFLINLNFVESFEDENSIKMLNQQSVIISRRKKNLLKLAMNNYAIEK
jgi:DNA-binding LytR/AlgR family response regulator